MDISSVGAKIHLHQLKSGNESHSVQSGGSTNVTGPPGALLFDRDQRSH